MPDNDPSYIIAIGASAGGMEEIFSFFDHTPLDSVAYVIVQHLSADFKSRMVELLSKHSMLTIVEAKNGILIKRNEVYLIPNDKFMTVRESKLYLTDKNRLQGPHLTINTFLSSLAIDCGNKAIAVILSGLGSDGTDGVKAIKQAGGMVIARNPDTTDFQSMPSHAIDTGLVDYILEPELMPAAIEDYVKDEKKRLAELSDDQKNITAITSLISETLPLDFSEYKKTTILRRTKRRAAAINFTRLDKYLEFLKVTPTEVEALAKDFLISVTSFFRDEAAFNCLENVVFPDILSKHKTGEDLKIWVAGCATGEEAYSIAIILSEYLSANNKDIIVKIFATDIDSNALNIAGKGVYNSTITNHVSANRLDKFFTKEDDAYKIKPEIRRMVIFSQHDLAKNPPYCNMDFISCRNLLIYLTPVLQKKIFNILLFGLKVRGYLFLGSSENPVPILKDLETINSKWRIYQNQKRRSSVSFDVFHLPELVDLKRITSVTKDMAVKNTFKGWTESMNANLAKELDYVAICVDENNQVLKSYGNSAKYLLQENFKTDITDLLPKPLAVIYNTLITEVSKTREAKSIDNIKINHNNAIVNINMSVSLLTSKNDDNPLFLVIFTEPKTSATSVNPGIVFDEAALHDQYIKNLEQEVKKLKQKLSSTNEMLDASNENLQSFNEELISANEEMQSTNEEMQSVNEELHTINSDYQLKNRELSELNDDLNNYFRSSINGQLFVDNDLKLVKFSPGTIKLINLLDNDIGRPLSNISTNIKLDTITTDIRVVIANGSIVSKELETNNGSWYQVVIMPYLQQTDNKAIGAIISFNDVTVLKKIQQDLDKKNASLLRINADLDNFAHTASHDLLGPLSSMELTIGAINRKVTDPEMKKYLAVINSSVKKFSGLIKEIGKVAKIENDRLATEIIDLDELITDIEWSLENKIEISGAIIIKDLKAPQIEFSKKNLRSIIFNLIANAIKFRSEQPPLIIIKTFLEKDEIILTVEDNGKGIPEAGLVKIFDMYGRLDASVEGNGIGLYLAKKIVDAAGGNLTVQSEIEKGTTFTLHFRNSI